MAKAQAVNPYLPGWEYIPDGEPYVVDGRVYIFGSHDRFGGTAYCMNDYVAWSAPVTDLADWRYEGVIYRKTQDPRNREGKHNLYAPDMQRGPDGRYYLYYAVNNFSVMSVAVCDTPAGAYEYYGDVHYPGGHVLGEKAGDIFNFDPGVLVDDDGRVYLYSGYAPASGVIRGEEHLRCEGGYCMELEPDMLTIKAGPELVFRRAGTAQGTDFEGHEFYEASSLRKIGDTYYFVYSSILGHELCYATSTRPDGGFTYGGTIVSIGDIGLDGRRSEEALNYTGNTHGGIIEINGRWYVFYHRQTNLHQFARQACAEPITILPDGSIPQVEVTSSGLNGGPLAGAGTYQARIACNLFSAEGAARYSPAQRMEAGIHPYFTQDEPDGEGGVQYIANLQQGAVAGFKYFNFENARAIRATCRGTGRGQLLVRTEAAGRPVAEIPIAPAEGWAPTAEAPLAAPGGVHPLYFTFNGEGYVDFLDFTLL